MSQALRTTQGVALQMSHQGSYSTSRNQAHGHVQRSMHEMHTATDRSLGSDGGEGS